MSPTRNRAVIPSLVTVLLLSQVAVAQRTKRVDGYDGYRFGMNFEEASKVRPDAKKTSCPYKGVVFCLDYETAIGGISGIAHIQFEGDVPRIGQIVVETGSIKEPPTVPCEDAAVILAKALTAQFGFRPYFDSPNNPWSSVVWNFEDGGVVRMEPLCLKSGKGLTVVVFNGGPAL